MTSDLTTEEQSIIIASAIGASVADLARVLPVMPRSERETILDAARRLSALQGEKIQTEGRSIL